MGGGAYASARSNCDRKDTPRLTGIRQAGALGLHLPGFQKRMNSDRRGLLLRFGFVLSQ